MNEKYNQEVFKFFTEDKNRFLMMGKIAQHESKVKKELIKSFWVELKDQLHKIFNEKNEDWIVEFSEDFTVSHNKIIIYRKKWLPTDDQFPIISTAFEQLASGQQPFIGVIVNINNKSYNVEGIKQHIRNSAKFENLRINTKNKWWPIMRDTALVW